VLERERFFAKESLLRRDLQKASYDACIHFSAVLKVKAQQLTGCRYHFWA
jgi:hypothetical protein